MDLDSKQIANNIKAERNRAGLTIEEVCSKLKVSRPTYIKYEKDADTIKASQMVALAKLFNCKIEMFFYTK